MTKDEMPVKQAGKFVKGKSGNPKGRPKVSDSYADLVRDLLERKIEMLTVTPMTTAKTALCVGQIRKAIKGDTTAAKELIDRAYGKVTDKLDLNNDLTITVNYVPSRKRIDNPSV